MDWYVEPAGVAVAPDGTIYLAAWEKPRIMAFDSTGTLLGEWGSSGSGNGQFANPTDVAVAPNGMVYVVDGGMDGGNNRIQVFDAAGTFLGKWGSKGRLPGQFQGPQDAAVAPDGTTIYVADSGIRIQSFCIAP